ncbi:MAG: hypothetical protein VR72_05185 [Clostridiaceae bacterium BRH_c20a]|nr:MAG: hypothetical protein VR72_05185 [Clostridiaceae bacterium BRH_c20a]
MIELISDIVKNVAIIILLTTFLEMLLPNNSMQGFIKVVMGLFVMLAILNPVVGLLKADYELTAWQLASLPEHKVETVLAQGEKIASMQEEQALSEYKIRIERQIEALLKLVPGIANVKCTVMIEPIYKIGAIGKIEKAVIWITPGELESSNIKVNPVEPVKIQIGEDNNSPVQVEDKYDREIEEKVINIVGNYYNLEKENIEVIFY